MLPLPDAHQSNLAGQPSAGLQQASGSVGLRFRAYATQVLQRSGESAKNVSFDCNSGGWHLRGWRLKHPLQIGCHVQKPPVYSALPTLCDQLLDGLSLTQTCSGMPVGLPRASTAPPGTSTNAAAPGGLQACVAGRASSVSYVDLSGPLGTHALACCAGLLGRELPPYQRHRHLHTRR